MTEHGVWAIDEDWRTGGIQVQCRSECDGVVDAFRSSIYLRALRPIKWHFLAIQREEILAEKLAHLFEQVTKSSYDRKVTPHSVAGPGYVNEIHDDDGQ
jgi:hypothetical protein